MDQHNNYDVVVIGGGITGLAAAFYAKLETAQNPLLSRVLLLEASSRVGGKIRSEFVDTGFESPLLLEWGADSMLSTKAEGLELAHLLGLDEELIETRKERQIFMLRRAKLIAMPEGLQLVIPQRLWPFIKSPLFSWGGKFDMAFDLLRPKRVLRHDESIASFMRRRLGQEALDLLAEPILSGIYSADPERQSLMATFPQLADLEQKYASLIKGALKTKAAPSTGERKTSLFVSFKNGMQTLVNALSKELEQEIKLNCEAHSVSQVENGLWRVVLKGGEQITARKVIITTPAAKSAALLSSLSPKASTLLSEFRRTSSGCAYLAYARGDVPHALKGYGVLIPKIERRQINAVTWVSSKMEGRAPASHVLFRTFFGGERDPEMMHNDDAEVIRVATREVASLHGIRKAPTYTRVFRAHSGNPQYDVGHLGRVAQIEAVLPKGLIVTGCAMRGVGIPDCIRQGRIAAQA